MTCDEGQEVVATQFFPQSNNTLGVATTQDLLTAATTDDNEHLCLYDVTKGEKVRSYKSAGSARKLLTSSNNSYKMTFVSDISRRHLAEIDKRSPNMQEFCCSVAGADQSSKDRHYDVSTIDEYLIGCGVQEKVALFDRRMVSVKKSLPFKEFECKKLSNQEKLNMSEVKFDPTGKRFIVAMNRNKYSNVICVHDTDDYDVINLMWTHDSNMNLERLESARLRNFNFLGEEGRYAMCDVDQSVNSIVFDVIEGKYLGVLKAQDQINRPFSKPHPRHCLIASTELSSVNLFAPIGKGKN